MKIFFLFLGLVLSVLTTEAQAQSSLIYGRSGADNEGYEVIPTSDGGFMTGGHSTDANGAIQYWVMKANGQGKVVWDSIYELGYDRSFLWSIQPNGHGGALLAGYTGIQNSGTESALIVEIDSVGRVIKTFDLNYAKADHAHWCARRKQGGFYWAGHTDSEGDPSGQMILERLDDNLDSVWQKTYDYQHNAGEHAHCGTLTADGGCVLAGHTTVGNLEQTWVVRVDSNGNEVWKKFCPSSPSSDDSPYGIVTTREGGFAIFGGMSNASGSSWMRLFVLDSAGNKIVDKHYGTGNSFGFDGVQTSDGGFALAGYKATQTTEFAEIVKTDSKGNQTWLKDFAGSGLAWGNTVFQHNRELVLIGGTAVNTSSNGNLWAIYLDSNGVQASYDTLRAGVVFTLDQTPVRASLIGPLVTDTVHGLLQNLSADSAHITVRTSSAQQWIVQEKIGNQTMILGSTQTLAFGPHESLPVELIVTPYAEKVDTESLCMTIGGQEGIQDQQLCIPLYLEAPSGVAPSDELPVSIYPNPAESYLVVSGLQAPGATYAIYSAVGSQVLVGAMPANGMLNVSVLPSGSYRIVVSADSAVLVNRAFTILH